METRTTAKGSLYMIATNMIALFGGFAIHIFLARGLGPEQYGGYGVIMSILLWVEYIVRMPVPATYRKVISENSELFDSVMYSMKRIFLPYCLIVLIVFSAITPLLAKFFNDSRLLLLLLLAGIDIPFMGIYAALIAILNGYRTFSKQSIAILFYTLCKTISVIVFMLLGFGLYWALIANILASVGGLLVGLYFVKGLESKKAPGEIMNINPRIMSFGVPALLAFLASMSLISTDMWLVKGLVSNDVMIGYYAVSYNLSRPVYLLISALDVVAFPSISKAFAAGDIQLSQKHIRQILRLSLLLLMPLIVIILATSNELLLLLFSSTYLPASTSLKILFAGVSIFAIYTFFVSTISAQNKPLYSFFISLGLIPVAVTLNYFLITSYGIGGAALATALTASIGLIITGIYLWKKFGALLDMMIFLRILVASGCMYLIAKYLPASGFFLLLKYCFLFLIYGGVLLITGEINRGDFTIIKETLGLKRKSVDSHDVP